jgi:hypothetical protein
MHGLIATEEVAVVVEDGDAEANTAECVSNLRCRSFERHAVGAILIDKRAGLLVLGQYDIPIETVEIEDERDARRDNHHHDGDPKEHRIEQREPRDDRKLHRHVRSAAALNYAARGRSRRRALSG